MPRTRRYQPIPDDVCRRKELSWCSESAQNLYFRLLANVDEDGRFDGDPCVILGALYPHSRHLTPGQVLHRMKELSDQRVLIRYRVDGEYFVKLIHYVSSAKKGSPRVRYPDPPANWRQWADGAPKGEQDHLFNRASGGRMGLNGTNGEEWDKRDESESFVSLPDTEYPLPVTTKSDSVPEPEPIRPNGPTAPTAVRCGSESASDSDCGGDEAEEQPCDVAQARKHFTASVNALAKGEPEKSVSQFRSAILQVLKPGESSASQKRKDTADITELYYSLSSRMPDRRSLRDALHECFELAVKKRVGGGGYGSWRLAVTKQYGAWSVRPKAAVQP